MKEEFLRDPEKYGSAERFLQLAIETINDMASHVIAEHGLGEVNASRVYARLLREHGYITTALEQRWIRMIGFGNILVHNYLDIDRNIVFDVIQNDLNDLRALRDVFVQSL
ncbi:type VII toxin-antitoxin system HepT family RNase toxin [Pelomicrobium sp.]|uniref:type VII toxin-antitoxin system HepT family RNase toxin n=1 Tax=Pelomicrobium sp. TaxID=2815319 RepID=UPI002FDCA31E